MKYVAKDLNEIADELARRAAIQEAIAENKRETKAIKAQAAAAARAYLDAEDLVRSTELKA